MPGISYICTSYSSREVGKGGKVKVKVNLKQSTKVHKGDRGIALLFL